MKYIVTWCPSGMAVEILSIIDGDLELTVSQIMDIVCAVEKVDPEEGYRIYSIVRAENAHVIY